MHTNARMQEQAPLELRWAQLLLDEAESRPEWQKANGKPNPGAIALALTKASGQKFSRTTVADWLAGRRRGVIGDAEKDWMPNPKALRAMRLVLGGISEEALWRRLNRPGIKPVGRARNRA